MTASADISLAALLVVSLSFAMLGAASAASAVPAESHAYVSPAAKVGFNPQPDPPGDQRPGDGSVKPGDGSVKPAQH
ncbi:hypothetical protein [Devosia sp.]|uniref:hypothetical protein n=1 Tax=Devosia sp. TaxID=1871048 RepID=UPI003264F2AC